MVFKLYYKETTQKKIIMFHVKHGITCFNHTQPNSQRFQKTSKRLPKEMNID